MIEWRTKRLFVAWLKSDAGGRVASGTADDYGSHMNCLTDYDARIFNEEGYLIANIEECRRGVDFAVQNARGRVVNALIKYKIFLRWLLEHPWTRNFDEYLNLIPVAENRVQNGFRIAVRNRVRHQERGQLVEKDAFQELFDYFGNTNAHMFVPSEFYRFGLTKSVYGDDISTEIVERQFDLLINLITTGEFGDVDANGRVRRSLAFRKYSGSSVKSNLFKRLYELLFPRARGFVVDGNSRPKLNMRLATRCELSSADYVAGDTRKILKNYVCSHVFDDKTKNPLLFEALWNVAYTPCMIDPMTGHETMGRWPEEFQPLFRNEIRRKFRRCMERFNDFAADVLPRVEDGVRQVVRELNVEGESAQSFMEDALEQWRTLSVDFEQVID